MLRRLWLVFWPLWWFEWSLRLFSRAPSWVLLQKDWLRLKLYNAGQIVPT